jgi:excisionase family DNA binding protein
MSVASNPAGPEEDTYTTGEAARILRMSDRGVRKMIDRGELEASTDERGRHLIPQRAVHALREERRATGPEAPEISAEGAVRSAEEARELRERVERPPEGARALRGPSGAHREDGEHPARGTGAPAASPGGGEGRAPARTIGAGHRAG